MSPDGRTAEDIVRLLGLEPHPEGGHYRETFRDGLGANGRAHSTAILYLLAAGQRSHWHKVDAAEVWHWYGGGSLRLSLHDGAAATAIRLGPDWAAGQVPQAVVPAHVWQSAEPEGAWVLLGCTVAPGFDFAGFELAPEGWQP